MKSHVNDALEEQLAQKVSTELRDATTAARRACAQAYSPGVDAEANRHEGYARGLQRCQQLVREHVPQGARTARINVLYSGGADPPRNSQGLTFQEWARRAGWSEAAQKLTGHGFETPEIQWQMGEDPDEIKAENVADAVRLADSLGVDYEYPGGKFNAMRTDDPAQNWYCIDLFTMEQLKKLANRLSAAGHVKEAGMVTWFMHRADYVGAQAFGGEYQPTGEWYCIDLHGIRKLQELEDALRQVGRWNDRDTVVWVISQARFVGSRHP